MFEKSKHGFAELSQDNLSIIFCLNEYILVIAVRI